MALKGVLNVLWPTCGLKLASPLLHVLVKPGDILTLAETHMVCKKQVLCSLDIYWSLWLYTHLSNKVIGFLQSVQHGSPTSGPPICIMRHVATSVNMYML